MSLSASAIYHLRVEKLRQNCVDRGGRSEGHSGVYVADWLSKLRVKIWNDPSNRIRPRQVTQIICCVVVWLA
jgi:hypothetical protein